jgi:hypothetical protein
LLLLLLPLFVCLFVFFSFSVVVIIFVARTDHASNLIHARSIRTTFDLFLTALNLPAGSEVVFTAVTIKDMIVIAKHHNLVPG